MPQDAAQALFLPRPSRQRRRVEDHTAETHQCPPASGGQHQVRVGPRPVQGEQIHRPGGVLVILLAEHLAVHAEDAHVPGSQRVPVHIDHVPVGNVGHHGVTLDAHGELRCLRDLIGDRQVVKILSEYRRRIAGSCRRPVQGDHPGLPLRCGPLQLRLIGQQRFQNGTDALSAGGGQAPVLLQQLPLLLGQDGPAVAEAVLEQRVGIDLQTVEQAEQDLFLGKADADLIIADRGRGNAQPLRQLRARQGQLLSACSDPVSQ